LPSGYQRRLQGFKAIPSGALVPSTPRFARRAPFPQGLGPGLHPPQLDGNRSRASLFVSIQRPGKGDFGARRRGGPPVILASVFFHPPGPGLASIFG